MIRKLIDTFLPGTLVNAGHGLRSERIFISVLLISALADLLGISLAMQLHLRVIVFLLASNAIVNLALLVLYKYGVPRNLVAHTFLFQHAISFGVQAWYQGGLITPATAAYFLLPAVTILILGKRSAIAWFIITALMISGFYIYEINYGAPAVQYPLDKRAYLFYGSVLGTNISIFILLLVYENNKNKALRLAEKKHQDLVITQAQLIQAEKMASLGELTAGIAHEIQNPLNFVNNFSEVNKELIEELNEEIQKGNLMAARDLAKSIQENEQKIIHHGKRADGIVKGMLQHSRTSSGKKEATDVNLLCDEYLRLAFHGLRAKDKTFNAKFEVNLDPTLPKLQVVPQEMGRVILNLINNAFYAVNEKSKVESQKSEISYEPTVTVTTKNLGDKIEISVKDNGPGIPAAIKDKIFQPFFTTKPTGQGTGLGLSLSFDIISKGHGGQLQVESREQEGSIFIITLPTK